MADPKRVVIEDHTAMSKQAWELCRVCGSKVKPGPTQCWNCGQMTGGAHGSRKKAVKGVPKEPPDSYWRSSGPTKPSAFARLWRSVVHGSFFCPKCKAEINPNSTDCPWCLRRIKDPAKAIPTERSRSAPLDLRAEVMKWVTENGDLGQLKLLIERCKADPRGLDILRDAHKAAILGGRPLLARDLHEAITSWQPQPASQTKVVGTPTAMRVGEHVPSDLRDGIKELVRVKREDYKQLIDRCKGYDDGKSLLVEARRIVDSRDAYWPGAELAKAFDDAIENWQPPRSVRLSGSNWYFGEDKARCLRQVVLISDPRRAVKSRFSALALPGSFIELIRNPLVTGLFPMSGYQENFLLVRTDRMVEEVAKSSLQVSFSFFHLPTSGLVAIHVSSVPLKAKARRGWLEQIYGLDSDLTRGLVENAVKGEGLHIIHAGEGGMRTKVVIVGGEKTGDMDGPLCKFDVDIPYENDCRSVLAEEWNALLRHHRSIPNPDFQAAGKRLYELMPEDVNPIRPRFPFEQFEHAMIFVKGPATNFQLSDDVHLVLEEMTGRSIDEVSLKARPMHVVRNSGGVVDDVAKGTRQAIIAATELGLKLRDKELPMRVLNDSLKVVERYFRDPESGVEMAIFMFYDV